MEKFFHAISNRAGHAAMRVLGFILIAASIASGSALATSNGPHPDPQTQREVLLNGLPIVTQTVPGDRVSVVCAIRAGAMFDPAGKSGLASLTASLLGAGAGSYTGERIRGELEDAGATLDTRTDWDATWVTGEAPASKLSVLLDIISLMVTAPRFAPADVEAHKKTAAERARAEASDPEEAADLALARALYGKHTYGRPVHGDPESIAGITQGDVRAFFQKFYVANGAALAVSGGTSGDEVMRLARPRFGRWLKGKLVPATFLPPTPAASTRVLVSDQSGLGDEAILRVGLLAPGRGGKDIHAVYNVAEALERDLAKRLPGARSVSAHYDLRTLDSPFWVSVRLPLAELSAALKAVSETMALYQSDQLIEPAPADPPKTGPAGLLAAAEFFRVQNLATGYERRALVGSQFTDAARSVLRPTALTVVVLGDSAKATAVLKQHGYPADLVPRS